MQFPQSFTFFVAGKTIIINPSGLFIYNGAPAPGTLVLSVTFTAGTDPYTNAYLPGFTEYTPTGSWITAVNIWATGVRWYYAPTEVGPYIFQTGLFQGWLSSTPNISPYLTVNTSFSIANVVYLLPSGDTSGVTDYNALTFCLNVRQFHVFLLPGVFYLSQPLIIDVSNVNIDGPSYGFGAQIVCKFTTAQYAMIVCGNNPAPTAVRTDIVLRNFALFDNTGTGAHGIAYRGEAGLIENVISQFAGADSLHVAPEDLFGSGGRFNDSLQVVNFYAQFPVNDGIYTGTHQTSSEITRCHCNGAINSNLSTPGGNIGIVDHGNGIKWLLDHPYGFLNGGAQFLGNGAQVIGGEYESNTQFQAQFGATCTRATIDNVLMYQGSGALAPVNDISFASGSAECEVKSVKLRSGATSASVNLSSGVGHKVHDCVFDNTAPHAITCDLGATMSYFDFSHNDINIAATSTGVIALANATNCVVDGNRIRAGVVGIVDNGTSGANFNIAVHNDVTACTGPQPIELSGVNDIARDNPGFNPRGSLTAPPYGTTTNPFSGPVRVFITGGAGVISIDGVATAISSPAIVPLEAGETIIPPAGGSWQWFGC